jgi:hypothetical protein
LNGSITLGEVTRQEVLPSITVLKSFRFPLLKTFVQLTLPDEGAMIMVRAKVIVFPEQFGDMALTSNCLTLNCPFKNWV